MHVRLLEPATVSVGGLQSALTPVAADVDGTGAVDDAAFHAVEMPRGEDGVQLSCPSLSGLVAKPVGGVSSRRRRRYGLRACAGIAWC